MVDQWERGYRKVAEAMVGILVLFIFNRIREVPWFDCEYPFDR